MHHASHILMHCIVLWCVINGGKTARNGASPDILANFAKNVASVLSPAILGDIQFRTNRSSFKSSLTEPASLHGGDLDSPSIHHNIVDKTSRAPTYYEPQSYPYNDLYENSPEGLEGNSEANAPPEGSPRDQPYLRQERPNFYRPYDFSANDNLEATEKPADTENIEPALGNIEESSTNLYSSYHDAGAGFDKAAFGQGPFLAKSFAGFPGFGPYGHFHGHHHHHHHHDHPYGEPPSDEAENNRTDHRGYGHPYGYDHGYHPYPHFPYGGYGDPFYGPHGRHRNNSSDNGNRHYGPYYDGPDFYGPPHYGYGRHNGNNNKNNNNNNNNNNNRQTEEPANNGDQNNSTRNGYPHPYGPPLFKPLGAFHLHGLPFPFDHFHGVLKGGPVGVGHLGYPIYAGPYPFGFPFHHSYGPFFHGKKYLPPKDKPSDSGESGESTEAPAGELAASENPERIIALNQEVVAPSSNRYKILRLNGLKPISLVDFENRRI